MDPSPRSLILDLLSTVGRASAPVRALVAAAALFGIAENSLRVALARLRAEGLVERDARGRYRLGPRAAALNEEIRAWRRVEERRVAWTGTWLAVQLGAAARLSAREQRQRARALRVVGFRPLAPGLEVRPDNLVGGVDAVRRRLTWLGLGSTGPICVLDQLDPAWEQAARELWDADDLVEGYRATRRRLDQSAERLGELPAGAAMTESFRLGGAAIRQIVFDPLLPEPIVPAAERLALVAAMRRYDRLGRHAWRGWLGEETPSDLPAGVRGPGPGAEALGAVERS